ncbi:MAG: carboxylesterase family protein [Schwartzia sp.]|nr:carboxylesterase family protein [Schwartzia sp. (in: firmicutes)]
MEYMNFSGAWKKRLATSLLSLSVLMATPAGIFPQDGQGCAFAAAAQEQAKDSQESKAAEATGDLLKTLNAERERLRAQYGENKKITDGAYDKSLAVKCVNGTFVGKRTGNVIAYKGIPFVGKQPVGELRWKAPVDVVPDDGVYEAYYNAKSPRQVDDRWQIASLYVQGEDCLHLNVWKADGESSEKKPVMVWIHGGAFEVGGTVEPREEGTNFVKENPDVILVSVEYRLGVFGFLHLSHLPDGADYPDTQNLGLMDQMAGLKWVHENIAAFGGDPDNVTIWGQSAGGGSVSLLPLIKDSHQYFQKVIVQSGSPVFTRSTEEAVACTNELMEALGCKTVADLQKVDADKLVSTAGPLLGLRVWAERDGSLLPQDPYEAYANGAAKDLTFLQGCTKDEMGYFICGVGLKDWDAFAADRYAKKMAQLTKDEQTLVESFCKDAKGVTSEYSSTNRLFDQIVFIAPLFRMSENQTSAGGKSYTYYFTPESSVPLLKSGHAVELSTVFNHPEETLVTGRIFDETFSKTMRKMWVQFAKTGNPSLSAKESPDGKAKEWPLYDLKDKNLMIFDEFNIHPEKASKRKILDWGRTYFLTKYYCI